MPDTDPYMGLPALDDKGVKNLDEEKIGDKIAQNAQDSSKPKSAIKKQKGKKGEDKKDKDKKKGKEEEKKKIPEDDKNKKEDSSTPKDLKEATEEAKENLDENSDMDNQEEKFSEYKAMVSFGEALNKSKKDPAGLAILKWVSKYIKQLDKFSDGTRAIIYSSLDRDRFVDKSRGDSSFPEFPNDITPEDQSRLCIDSFARKYLVSDSTLEDKDLLSIRLSCETLVEKRKNKDKDIKSGVENLVNPKGKIEDKPYFGSTAFSQPEK